MAEKKNLMTYEGLKKLEDELQELKVVKRKEVAQKIKEARELGDLSENAEYDAAKDEQRDIEARIEEIFTLVNKDITSHGVKNNISSVILTGEGIININKSDMAGRIILSIPVKNSTGRLVSSVKSTYRVSYALVRYIAARPYAKTVSSSISVKTERNILKTVLGKVKDFFYS